MRPQNFSAKDLLTVQEHFCRFLKQGEASECWLWIGGDNGNGYGVFGFRGITYNAHRIAFLLWKGIIPEGLDVDHLCRNRLCVNPNHLEAVTRRENLLRGQTIIAARATQTHCIHGHEFTKENTRIKNNGCRACRTCDNSNRDRTRSRVS